MSGLLVGVSDGGYTKGLLSSRTMPPLPPQTLRPSPLSPLPPHQTLLDILAGRKSGPLVGGELRVNGHLTTAEGRRHMAG